MSGAFTQIVFETHAWSEDNDLGLATGWGPGELSSKGRYQAKVLGVRRRNDGLAAVFVSDLRRALETAELAFAGLDVPILHDWRLRECNYGDLNGAPREVVHAAVNGVDDRYPGGESWLEAIRRVSGVLSDIHDWWPGQRVLIIGHMSGYWALEHLLHEMPLEDVNGPFDWQEGWEYRIRVSAPD
jgi:2,3-bisphosphoglycerate-dependent phosphoglycerate mutase